MVGRWRLGIAAAVGLSPLATACEMELDTVETRSHATATRLLRIQPDRDIDILFVIDDSSDAALAQARLVASNIAARLDDGWCPLDYHLAFTTTDTGNPACDPASADNGRFVASSCLGRLPVPSSGGGRLSGLDASTAACANTCALSPGDLDERMRPTTTDYDETPRVRPWLERIDGRTNMPEGVGLVDAFPCVALQGNEGCAFPSPLEALEQALVRMRTPGEPEYGFSRPGVPLFVVFVTTGHECSYREPDIFSPDGARTFWTDPTGEAATQGVCWRAGVACSGGPGEYETCRAVDLDEEGNADANEAASVLRPVAGYVELLQAVEDEKKALDLDVEVMVSVITGVPDGYSVGQGDLVYADSPDAAFQGRYGIGPGCTDVAGGLDALPPVRLREFAEHFGDRNLYSACDPDYEPALSPVFDRVEVGLFRPLCFRNCVEDVDPTAEGLQPECYVEEQAPGEPAALVEPCALGEGVWSYPSEDVDVCWFPLTDQTQTGSAMDDMSDDCIAWGLNLEFEILRREGTTTPGGTTTTATCITSAMPQIDCPAMD